MPPLAWAKLYNSLPNGTVYKQQSAYYTLFVYIKGKLTTCHWNTTQSKFLCGSIWSGVYVTSSSTGYVRNTYVSSATRLVMQVASAIRRPKFWDLCLRTYILLHHFTTSVYIGLPLPGILRTPSHCRCAISTHRHSPTLCSIETTWMKPEVSWTSQYTDWWITSFSYSFIECYALDVEISLHHVHGIMRPMSLGTGKSIHWH